MTQRTNTYLFAGGLDPSTSPLLLPPGRVMSGINYEAVMEGYRRMDGIERFDGQPAPSECRFHTLRFTAGSNAIEAGDVVTGADSGATGTVVLVPALSSGSWANDDAAGLLVLVETIGTFVQGENLTVASVVRAVASDPADLEGVADYDTYLDYAGIAQDHCRASIGKPAGSGAIRGVAVFDGDVYCWRDNAGATSAGMWKASPSGWQAVAMPRLLRFTAGLVEIADGATILGATSGVTATAHRVVRKSGSWGSDAAGYIVLSAASGTFASEQIKVGAATVATVTPDTAVVLPSGGRYMTIEHNFYGAANRKALYGVNGTGLAFEFMDGILTPIETGTVPDVPTRIFEIANHLGLTFAGGSVQLSAPGEPLIFDVVQGAAELGFGTEITDVTQSNESAVAIYGRSKIAMLTGRDSETFTLQELTEEAGALPWTVQRIARTIYMDGRGLRDLSATQAFGNFRAGSVLPELAAFFLARQKSGATPVLSYICKSKSHYRVLWDDGVGLCVHMGRKSPEAMQFSVDPLRFTCAASGEMADGEAMFAGGEDGFVYRIDSGTSLDGEPISGFVLTPFNHLGAPLMDKRLHKTTLELDGSASAHIGITAIFDYGAFGQPYAVLDEVLVDAGGGLWNTAVWNEFYWSQVIRGRGEFHSDGIGANVAIIFACKSKAAEPSHTLQAYSLHWSPRRLLR